MRFATAASLVNHAQQQIQQLNGVANDAEIITNTTEKVDDTANVSRGQLLFLDVSLKSNGCIKKSVI